MLIRTRLGLLALLCSVSGSAYAEGGGGSCVDVSVPKQAIASHNGRWIELTTTQWQFLRGVYAMHPATALGLPYGDKAVLAQLTSEGGGMVFTAMMRSMPISRSTSTGSGSEMPPSM